MHQLHDALDGGTIVQITFYLSGVDVKQPGARGLGFMGVFFTATVSSVI
jgi:hypothetical protein